MGLPRLKPHERVDGRAMNILLDGLEALISGSLPGQSTDVTTLTTSSLVTSVRGAGGITASPSTGAVGLFDLSPPVQYYVRREQVVPQSFTVGGANLFPVSFPIVVADPKSQTIGNYGFDLGIGGIRRGDMFLVHSRVTFQSPGAWSPFYANVEWNPSGTFVQGSGSMGATWSFTRTNRTVPTNQIGVLWIEILGIAFYFPENGNAVMGPLGLLVDNNDPSSLPFTFTTTGNPIENFLEVFYIGFNPLFA